MPMRPQNVMADDWKYLIVLDACRFDSFRKLFSRFLTGDLEPRNAGAIWTLEWLQKNFTDYYEDVAYISSVWFCNSLETVKRRHWRFSGAEHFVKVYDAWRWLWNDNVGTVLPWDLSRLARRTILKHPEWRFIIHFLQPHAPYLSLVDSVHHVHNRGNVPVISAKKALLRHFIRLYQEIFGVQSLWNMMKRFNMRPRTSLEESWRVAGSNLVSHYEKNLQITLFFVHRLIQRLPPGKIVLTSDHGELLGEQGWWGHSPPKPRIPALLIVPWFEVDRGKLD